LDLYEKEYRYYLSTLDQARIGDKGGNMSVVQQPTPPGIDSKKAMKLLGMAFGGFVGMGLALAFLLDFVIDQTIKRTIEVKRHLKVPRNGKHKGNGSQRGEPATNGSAVVRWDARNSIQLYANGLRERLITHFEGSGVQHSGPRRVAVTSCTAGAGVTTIANSLAASLSKIPDVKVLLVDMNISHGVARTFRNGEACTTDEKAHSYMPPMDEDGKPAPKTEADNLAVVPMRNGNGHTNGNGGKGLPTGLAHLAPQFDANDHDFIIFDLPPASPTSMTPRLSGYMDIVLLVLESEKTGRQTAQHASELMKNSRANVACVLNKYRKYVPEKLVPEF
jgi:Mrp family chromosome partitioning ATPase